MKWVRKQNYKYYVVDEISMISGHLWRLLCELKRLTKATFLLVGDYRQLPPVEESDIDYFEHPAIKWLCNSTRCELTEMKRYDIDLWNVSEKVYEDDTYNPAELYDNVSIQEMSKSHNICYTNRTRKRINEAVNNYMTKNKKYINIEYTGDKKEPPQSVKAYEGMPLIATKNSKKGEWSIMKHLKLKVWMTSN
jgi:ATP-dependent exoDNAse (exonuclease V) alpha subunit